MYPPKNFAPSTFRYDKYDINDTLTIGLDTLLGAYDKRAVIMDRVVEGTGDPMPPANPPAVALTEQEKALFKSWIEAGAPRDSTDL